MLSKGMYVSCPIIKKGIEIYVLGRIEKYDESSKELEVSFFDWKYKNNYLQILSDNSRKYYDFEVKRASSICSIPARWGKIEVFIICEFDNDKNNLKQYVCKYTKGKKNCFSIISESELDIDFYNIRNCATDEACRFRNTDIKLFFVRKFLSERRARMDSLEGVIISLINTRVYLYPHQIDAVVKAVKGHQTRVMLADEVGLGKTIEALTILKYYIQKNTIFRCIIVVPESLEYQWFNEINERFRINAEIFSYNKVIYKKTNATTYIISYGDYYKYRYVIEEKKWDMIIIDEAHKILNSPYYSVLYSATIKTRNVILLSATPIVHDGIEYLRLMKMVNPSRYKSINKEKFKLLIETQKKVANKLVEMNIDLEFYDDPDIKDSFIINFKELNEELQDQYLGQIIEAISINSEDNGLYPVNLAMEYLKRQYVIETNVIRHRREEVKEARIKRNLTKVNSYYMEGADLEVYERNMYDLLLSLTELKINSSNKEKWIKAMEAMLSSPYALKTYYKYLELTTEEKKEFFTLLRKWTDFCDNEIKQLTKRYTDNNTRLSNFINIIETCNADKILVFSSFKETVEILYELVKSKYGIDSVVMFTSDMSRLQTQLAARTFQNEKKCRFIISDKSGGEGRNFQKADLIIHFDLPWSPAMMEQRIGRLDRIGRDAERDVNSIVICSNETVEQNIFDIHNNSLKVFTRSLCGLEIIFDKLQKKIENHYMHDPEFGLFHAKGEIEDLVSSMEAGVEEEIYNASFYDRDGTGLTYIESVSNLFEDKIETDAEDNIMYWVNKSGVNAIRDTKTGTVTIDCINAAPIVLQLDMFHEAFSMNEYHGTFRRACAIESDSVDYFSPSHDLYRTFIKQLDRKQRGRFLAISMAEEVRWAGFLFVWNIELDNVQLLKGGMNPEAYHYLKKYLNEQQITNSFKIYGKDDIDENDIIPLLELEKMRIIENIEDTVAFEIVYDEDSWEDYVNKALDDASKRAKSTANSWLKINELMNLSIRDRIAMEIAKKTVCNPDKKRTKIENAMKNAVVYCKPQIDSILYIEM